MNQGPDGSTVAERQGVYHAWSTGPPGLDDHSSASWNSLRVGTPPYLH